MSKILIAGCGYVGTSLAEGLLRSGDDVWGMRRKPESLPEALRPLKADLNDPDTLLNLPEGLDYVFYTAGASAFSEEAYREAYIRGVSNLLSALEAQGNRPKRILFTSSTGVYAQQDGRWVDETSPTEPTSFSGRTVLEAERLFQESPFETVSLRLGGIYGPGRTALIDRVRKGEATLEAKSRYLNLIHLEDIVGALTHLMKIEPVQEVYVGVDSDPQEWNALIRWITCELALPEPPVDANADSKRPPRNRRCSNARLRASGYEFRFPSCREGYRELIRPAG